MKKLSFVFASFSLIALLAGCHGSGKVVSNPKGKNKVDSTVIVEPGPVYLEKPIIYLYPTTNTTVNVQLDINGELAYTYPKYPANTGWTVQASPDGNLKDLQTGREYYALYWEGKSQKLNMNPTEGFVVAGAETATFLEEKLAALGLSAREANEFIVYWLPQMESNAYNFIHFAGSDYTENAKLNISPTPETLIRVFMQFRPMDAPMKVQAQQLQSPVRKGFTVVEWGGMKMPSLDF